MTKKRSLLVLALTASALMQAREAVAESGRCFDLALPILEKLLAPGKVQRVFIQAKDQKVRGLTSPQRIGDNSTSQ